MKGFKLILAFLFVALVMALALTGCEQPIKDCQYYIDQNTNNFTECQFKQGE